MYDFENISVNMIISKNISKTLQTNENEHVTLWLTETGRSIGSQGAN